MPTSTSAPRNALVTGGSSGIGAAAAVKLAEDGYSITLVARRLESLNSVRKSLPIVREGQQHYVWQLDLADTAAVTELRGAPLPASSYEVFVSNAGIGELSPLVEHDDARWQRLLRVNLIAPIALTKELVKGMTSTPRTTPAHIIFISSTFSLRGFPTASVYSASKGGIDSFACSLAHELGPQRIHVNTIHPGPTRTEMTSDYEPSSLRVLPISGWIEPEAIGDAVMFVIKSPNITGAKIPVDNGSSA